jgi:hypothetical protein
MLRNENQLPLAVVSQELLERKAQLQEAIKKEAELIDQYKVEMKKFPRRSVRFPSVEDDESVRFASKTLSCSL